MALIPEKRVPTLRFKDEMGRDYPDWEMKKLDDVGDIVGGGTPSTDKKSLWDGDINWFIPTEIKSKYSTGSIRKVTKKGVAQSSATLLPVGTILFTSRATIGEVSIACEICTTNQGFQSFIVNDSLFSNECFYYWLLANKKHFLRRANGSTFLEISKREIKKIPLSVPDIQEQQKIAAFLSSVDTKIEQLNRKKSLLEQYKKGMMQKLFSQQIRFKDEDRRNYPDWGNNILGELFEIKVGGDIEKTHLRKTRDSVFCYPVYANSENFKGLHGYSDQYRVSKDCITVSGRGVGIGVAHARFEKFYPIVRLLVLHPKNACNLMFFEYAINELRIFNESTGVPQLTSPQLKTYRINVPDVEEQQKIADFLSAIDRKIELVAGQIEQARTFKQGLLQQMFI